MTHYLPPSLLALFAPRPPLPYLSPIDKKKPLSYTGIGQYIQAFEDPSKVDYSQFRPIETKQQIKERKARERASLHEQQLQEVIKECLLRVFFFQKKLVCLM
eukprot:TRINITY_DN2179_c0_g1_i2.p1 TRINITY_DN2179_c0_g1~~TRINITY_DN2179_c0_g1_i2.p1  ORF type:complete len:102 (-),score=15.88 TRINITY_DN2179_c0_g1_i2:31-336(-)